MSTLSKFGTKKHSDNLEFRDQKVVNFMGETSYNLSPLQTLKIVAASSIFGEPQYYRDGIRKTSGGRNDWYNDHLILMDIFSEEKTAPEIFESAIDAALDYDFKATLDFALELRTDYFMRLNPAVIFVRASLHASRKKFNESNPGYMKMIGKKIAERPDDLTNQFDYYMYKNGSKSKLPSIIKRTWSERLSEYSRYQLNKYKGKKIIDLVRIAHASGDDINELMKTGKLEMKETEMTWESLKSSGKKWREIIEQISIPHMALLRNLRGIFSEITEIEATRKLLEELKGGVLKGKQFPFRYWSAYKAIENSDVQNKHVILDALEECLDLSLANMPKLKGKVACLSDNSGSAWGAFSSEYGTVTVAEIANLSSIITALQADQGEVGVFGDNLLLQGVSQRNGIMNQLKEKCEQGEQQGQGTENGIWVFWDDAIKNKKHYDTVFIYSDMQAGHGNLYGFPQTVGQSPFGVKQGDTYIDVLAMVRAYRKAVNPKVNVFTVQVGGYNNNILPENLYRGAILQGWTGKECHYADSIIKIWDEQEAKQK